MSPTSNIRWCLDHDEARTYFHAYAECRYGERVVVPADIWEHVQVILNEFNEHPIPELLEDG